MQMNELKTMTVVQLRKLAKEHKVKLGAGIDKDGIIARLSEVLVEKDSSEVAVVDAQPKTAKVAEKPVLVQEKMSDEILGMPETHSIAAKDLQTTPPAADVTSIQPMGKPMRQAYQAPPASPDNGAKPAWQMPQRPVGTVNRFGPQNVGSQDPYARTSQPATQQQQPVQEGNAKLDGYRLGYRAQQRPYQNRNNDNGYGGGYQRNNNNRPDYGYQQRNYQPQQQTSRNYQQPNNYHNQQNNGYQQQNPTFQQANNYRPAPYQPPVSANESDRFYQMSRDAQFAQSVQNNTMPDMLTLADTQDVSGVLEILADGYGFLRGKTLLQGRNDTYVSTAQIRRYDLRTGDYVAGKARTQRENDKYVALLVVESINGVPVEENQQRLYFDELIPIYPQKRIVLEAENNEEQLAIRLVDLISPIGFGQRAMIVSPPDAPRLDLLCDMSNAIKRNDEEAEVLMLLIDIAPEEATEIKEKSNAEVFASTFTEPPENHARVSETMLERAERLVEAGRNVVILLDSLTKLSRAYHAVASQNGRPMNNTVPATALVKPKKFFGSACNTRDGGSLTVIATISVETGSRVDEIIFEEFKNTANMELVLLKPQANDPMQPMIDLRASGTKKGDMLLSQEQLEGLQSIRKVLASATNGEAVVQLIDMMQKTKCNADLLARLQDWILMWEKSGYLQK